MNSSIESRVNVLIGDIEGDMPVHAQSLHEVVLRNVSQLNEQMTRLEYSVPTVCFFKMFFFLFAKMALWASHICLSTCLYPNPLIRTVFIPSRKVFMDLFTL